MQSVLPTDELSPYTGIQLEDVPHLKPGTEYRLVLSSRAPSEDFSLALPRRGWSGLHHTRLNAV